MLKKTLVVLLLSLLTACATTPKFDTSSVDQSITPKDAVATMATVQGKHVLWGGMIIAAVNLEQGTQIEVLGYPLDPRQRPITTKKPLGRFLIIREEYLETVEYAQGRLLTVIGPLLENRRGRIGETDYSYPLVSAEQLHLWAKGDRRREPQLHFGIGVIFSN